MVRGGLDVEGDVSGIYLGGGGDEISGNVLAAVVSNPGPEPEPEGDEPASDINTSRKAVTSHCLARYPGALSLPF